MAGVDHCHDPPHIYLTVVADRSFDDLCTEAAKGLDEGDAAPVLGSRQTDRVAHYPEQRSVRIDIDRLLVTVGREIRHSRVPRSGAPTTGFCRSVLIVGGSCRVPHSSFRVVSFATKTGWPKSAESSKTSAPSRSLSSRHPCHLPGHDARASPA